ncbi:MAG: UDP-forming cellulose synthase catalytic subunit [Leptolyngbyaceae cyanobacterium CRU_2_3]|nr:UDP-forming cellulose synthase catalytic subunit [Leptolyngbyaceae cyanobacterium CRU_2_3]
MVSLALFFVPLITIRPNLWQQTIIGAIVILFGRLFLYLEERRTESRVSESLHLLLITLSIMTTLRYLYYRATYTLNFDEWIDTVFSLLLFLAELYGMVTLTLAYFQTLKIQHRKPIDLEVLPQDQWPTVDVYIPTYNEDVEIVRKTLLGALAIDYPSDKKQVYILDDGRAEKYRQRRQQLQQMCEELGSVMLTRDNNEHAKAGNINTALEKTQGDLVMILDCDHIPVRGFLKETVGFFLKERVSLVQTPHWFYNPDPFERNLFTEGQIPVGNELFYKVLQRGNDAWNAAFFCGSAAVVRRSHLLSVGGIATETVTEDCHTSLKLHSKGYATVYYDKIMVAGLAPEKFSSFVGQQVRWARGMAQILRLENPLFNRKLKLQLSQRVCYFSATSHFFFGFPRLMYAIAPTMFLLFGINPVKGLGLETFAYALPHIILSMQTNHIPYKHVRFSFWNEIYEFAMSFQAGIVTILALVNPKLGTFNVTDKGLTVTERSFDLESVRYLVILGALTGASLIAVPFWLIISPLEIQAVLINALWCLFNLLLVSAACLAAFEQPQLRRAHRLPRQLTAIIHSDDEQLTGTTLNVSESGARILFESWPNIPDEVRIELVGDYGARVLLEAQVVRGIATDKLQAILSVDFINLNRTQLDDLMIVLYSDVREWYSQRRTETDKPFKSLRFIATSLRRAFRELKPADELKVRKRVRTTAILFWEEWEGTSYTAKVNEMGMHDLRLEVSGIPAFQLDLLQDSQPTLALLMDSGQNAAPQSLLAQVQSVEVISNLAEIEVPPRESGIQGTLNGNLPSLRAVMELSFPSALERQQRSKIRQILRSLG